MCSSRLFVPIKDKIAFFTWLVGSKTPNPQSLFPVKSPLPNPSEAIVRFLTPDYLTALIKFIGIPHSPNPPARRKSPSLIPLIASDGVLQILANLKNDLESMVVSILFLDY